MLPQTMLRFRYPYNAEGRLRQLGESWITPIGRHFVRNHSTVPEIDPKEYTLTVHGTGVRTRTWLGVRRCLCRHIFDTHSWIIFYD
jgi:hypothetical protein